MAKGKWLSLCMIVRNEAENLGRCLESVRGVADELIVVDTGSDDDTVAVARRYGAIVGHEPWRDDFAAARNRSLELASGEWVLYLDADEELSAGSKRHFPTLLKATDAEGYFVQVVNRVGDPRAGEQELTTALRLFRNRPRYRFCGALHEQVIPAILAARPGARLVLTPVRVLHHGYRDDVRARKQKHQRNVRILTRMLAATPADPFLLFNLGLEHLLAGETESALADLDRALAMAPADRTWRPKLVKCYLTALGALGRWPEVLTGLATELACYPDYTDLHYLQGVAHQQLGAQAAAVAAFSRCLALGPAPSSRYTAIDPSVGGVRAQFALGQSFEALGDAVAALRAYIAAARSQPGWVVPLQNAAVLLKERVPPERLPRLLEALVPAAVPQQSLMVAALLLHADCPHEALRYMERAYATTAPPPECERIRALCIAKTNPAAAAYQMEGGDKGGNGACPRL